MSCDKTEKTCHTTCQTSIPTTTCNNGIGGYLIIIVLYILLAIIIGSCLNF